jgi:hypothetical protein
MPIASGAPGTLPLHPDLRHHHPYLPLHPPRPIAPPCSPLRPSSLPPPLLHASAFPAGAQPPPPTSNATIPRAHRP